MVNKWRLDEKTMNNHHQKIVNEERTLREDNVEPETVVDIIKDFQEKAIETKYEKLKDNATDLEIQAKAKEVEKIYKEFNLEMEWEAINKTAIEKIQEEKSLQPRMKVFCKWLKKEHENFLSFQKKIVTLVEEEGLLENYIRLNNDFKKRLDDEN